MSNLIDQKMPSPNEIFLPNVVVTNSVDDVKHRTPIRKTIKAIKKVCAYIICLLMMLTELNSAFHLKYLENLHEVMLIV